MKKIKKGKKLWWTMTDTPSGGQELLLGKELPKEIKDRYDREPLLEEKKT